MLLYCVSTVISVLHFGMGSTKKKVQELFIYGWLGDKVYKRWADENFNVIRI